MDVAYTPSFVRQLKKLEPELQQEVIEKVALFKDKRNHKQLKVHKLHGRMTGRYSFAVNYRVRVVFSFLTRQEAALLAIGEHDVYQ